MMQTDVIGLPQLRGADLPEERWDERLLTALGGALDAGVLMAMRSVVDAVLAPRPEEVEGLRRSAQPFLSGQLWDDPRSYFGFLEQPVKPRTVNGRFQRALKGGSIIAREFTAVYKPYPGPGGATDGPVVEDERILVEHWMHELRRPRATVVALHGFSMGYPRVDSFALFASQLFAEGMDVALMTLPYHGKRTPTGARFSGEYFAAAHVARLNAAVRRAIFEIHLLVRWLRAHTGGAPVGLLGLSLGGYLSALMAGLTNDLAFVIPMVPPVCMGDMAWRFFTTNRKLQNGGVAFGQDELRAAYRVHSPLTFQRQMDRSRLLILAGRGDRIVPPDHPHTLWQHWEEPQIYWFSGSHIAPFRRARMFARIREHIEGCTNGGH